MTRLTHGEFFEYAIDPDEEPDAELVAAIEEHRLECANCRALEEDYPKIREMARSLPDEVPELRPEFEEELMAVARQVIAEQRAEERAKKRGLVASFAGLRFGRQLLAAAAMIGVVALTSWAVVPGLSSREHLDLGVTAGGHSEALSAAQRTLSEARWAKAQRNLKSDPPVEAVDPVPLATKALQAFKALEKERDVAIDAHLGAAGSLLLLGRTAEASDEAKAVLDDPSATESQKKSAQEMR